MTLMTRTSPGVFELVEPDGKTLATPRIPRIQRVHQGKRRRKETQAQAVGRGAPDRGMLRMECLRPGESAMGNLMVTIGVGDQQGGQFQYIQVTVDTGSTFTAVPRALLQRLGVPVRRSARSRLADGSSVPVDIGWTMIRLQGQTLPTQVIFAEENQPSLLGMVALKEALLAVDPVGQQLVPVEAMR